MLSNLAFLVLIGLIIGTMARWWNPASYPHGMPITMTIGVIGALLGGVLSWMFWPPTEVPFHVGGLLISILGALAVLWLYSARTGRSHS